MFGKRGEGRQAIEMRRHITTAEPPARNAMSRYETKSPQGRNGIVSSRLKL
jgi:hypothetical protein